MAALTNKIDFVLLVSVKMANPNGDPLNGNRPRIDYGSYGEITAECIKRKIVCRIWDIPLWYSLMSAAMRAILL